MTCSFNLLETALSGAATGGIWTQLGYGTDGINFNGTGSTIPLFGDNPSIDPSSLIAGYYLLVYDDGCNPSQQVIIKVNNHLSSGTATTRTFCINDGITINLADGLSGQSAGGTWFISSSSVQPPTLAYDLVAGTLNLSLLVTHGTYRFIYSVSPTVTSGFSQLPCVSCSSLTEVVVEVTPAFFAGSNNTITVTDTAGAFSLYDNLIGIADNSGSWEQVQGATVAITGGYIGTINLNSITGCLFKFRYFGGGGNCASESFVTVNKVVDYGLNVTYFGGVLTANHTACSSTMTYQWYYKVGLSWVLIIGATSQTYSTDTPNEYKVIVNCVGCVQEDTYTVPEQICSNTACFNATLQQVGDLAAYQITANGTQSSPVSTDIYEYSSNGGAFTAFSPSTPLSGCMVSERINASYYCSINGGKIRVGYDGMSLCPNRQVDSLRLEYGNNTQQNIFGAIDSWYEEWTPAEWIAKGRSLTFRITVNTPIGVLVQYVKFTYNGTNQVSCSNMITEIGVRPILFYPIVIRRTVTYSDGCPPTVCSQAYNQTPACALDVYILNCNSSGNIAGLCTSILNCSPSPPSIVWKKDNVVLAGETAQFVPTSYGNGIYEAIVTCGSCVKSDIYILQTAGCTVSVTISESSGILTANVTGCGSSPTYQWAFLASGGTTWTNLGTASTQSAAPITTSGTIRVIVTCGSCTAQTSSFYNLPCTSQTANITASGSTLTVSVAGCATTPTYQWSYSNGGSPMTLGTASTQAASQGGGLYSVLVTCGGCTTNATYQYTPSCAVTATITSNGAPLLILTANQTGCVGAVTYLWERLNGTTWVSAGTSQTLTPTTQALYRVTISCGGCTAQAQYNYTSCSAAVTINTNGSVLTAFATGCSGTVVYNWEMSINGGTSYSFVANTQQITVSQTAIYRVTVTCGGCTAQAQTTYTSSCNSNVTLAYNAGTNLLTATNTGCGSVIYIWQFSPNYNPTSQGCTGWTQVASGVTTYTPTQTGCYRIATFCGTMGACPSEATLYVSIANPCSGLSLPVTTSTGLVNFDKLYNNGVAVTNYLISWRNASNVEIYRSANGSYYNAATTLPHPSNNVPFPAGSYSMIILNSDAGNNLDCFSDINVPLIQCSDNYELSYNGAGGVAATTSASISVNASTGHLKIFLQTFTVADTLDVIYNGSIIFTSGAVSTTAGVVYVVPISYVSGQNSVTVNVTNYAPASNTQYLIKIRCCQTQTPCPINLPIVGFNSSSVNPYTCSCDVILNFSYGGSVAGAYESLCRAISEYTRDYPTQYGGCSNAIFSTNYACAACAVTTVKGSGASMVMTFPAGCAAKYTALKAALQSTTDTNKLVRVTLRTVSCASDGAYQPIDIYPAFSTISFNDTTRAITIAMQSSNPYPDSCTNCTKLLRSNWQNTYDNFNNASSYLYTSTWVSMYGFDVRGAVANNIEPVDFVERLITSCGTSERKYRISFRNAGCACQSWQIHEDTNNDGNYETLRIEAAGWTGSCV